MIPQLDHHSPFACGLPRVIDVVDRDENRRKACAGLGGEGRGGASRGPVGAPGAAKRPAAARTSGRASRKPPVKAAAAPRLDAFYTLDAVAARCLREAAKHFDFGSCLLIEPSAGGGAFSRQMPANTVAVDKAPGHRGIIAVDYLEIEFRCDRLIITVGNPPFGRNASLARRFFNWAARQSDGIAMILPRSFLKARIENGLDSDFHLVWEWEIPPRSFVHRGKIRDVAAVFQIWKRRAVPREPRLEELTHPDFRFVKPPLEDLRLVMPSFADFTIRRVGVNAGEVGCDLAATESTHYFIRGDAATGASVEAVMRRLDLRTPAARATATRSLAKSEIVAAYRAATGRRTSRKRR